MTVWITRFPEDWAAAKIVRQYLCGQYKTKKCKHQVPSDDNQNDGKSDGNINDNDDKGARAGTDNEGVGMDADNKEKGLCEDEPACPKHYCVQVASD